MRSLLKGIALTAAAVFCISTLSNAQQQYYETTIYGWGGQSTGTDGSTVTCPNPDGVCATYDNLTNPSLQQFSVGDELSVSFADGTKEKVKVVSLSGRFDEHGNIQGGTFSYIKEDDGK